MARYATLDDLDRFGRQIIAEDRQAMVRKAERASLAGSIFLSHSSKDEKYLPGVMKVLENHGGRVYIDKKDAELPPYTSRDTARILKSRIEDCRKFIIFATKASKDSRWVPWELGISDGVKGSKNTAVLPGINDPTDVSWPEQEYMGIYDRIVWGKHESYEKEIWMVLNQEKNTATELSEWLRS